jgi:hypothetical protein
MKVPTNVEHKYIQIYDGKVRYSEDTSLFYYEMYLEKLMQYGWGRYFSKVVLI